VHREFLMSNKVKCYSYIPWSSDKQASGSSSIRQESLAKQIAIKNDLQLVEIHDKGISVFKGDNIKKRRFRGVY